MQVKTLGIVLKTIKYSDTSLISTIFTKELGVLTFMIKGALRMIKKGKGIILQPGQILDLEIQYRENRNFQILRDHKLEVIYADIDFHFVKKSIVLFLVEFTKNIASVNQENEELFDLLYNHLIQLDKSDTATNRSSISYMQKSAAVLGFDISNEERKGNFFDLLNGEFVANKTNTHTLDIDDSDLLYKYSANDNIALNARERKTLFDIYLHYFELHVPGFSKMNSPDIIREIFSS